MPRVPLSNPWPGPVRPEDRNPVPEKERHLGHPTAPGLRDEAEVTMGRPSPGNGQPGVPRIIPGRKGTSGIPGSGFGHPTQPDVEYDGPHDF